MKHYEPIRLELLGDTTEGVAEHGKAIAVELKVLQAESSHERVGATHEAMMVVEEKLPGMITSAEALAKAESFDAARTAFFELSMPWFDGAKVQPVRTVLRSPTAPWTRNPGCPAWRRAAFLQPNN